MTTRLSLNRLRTLARRREDYVGTWLPEPLLTAPDVAHDVELADSVSTAMLLVLETLPPTERAVFVLREVFDVPYAEIAEALEKSEAGGAADRQPGAYARGRAPPARVRHRGAARRGDRAVPRGDRDRRPAGTDGRAGPRRRADDRRRRQGEGRAQPHLRSREGAALPHRGDARGARARAGLAQRVTGDPVRRRRAPRRRRHDARRGRRGDAAVPRAQPRQARVGGRRRCGLDR